MKLKDADIYPKFEFRLSHRDKAWLKAELLALKTKFNEGDAPVVTKNDLVVAALRHGLRFLKQRRKI